jgi:HK97 family phage major capsid protein
MRTIQEMQNAGLTGALLETKEAGADDVTAEIKELGAEIGKTVKELRAKNEELESGKLSSSEFKTFSDKLDVDLKKLEDSLTEGLKTMRGSDSDEIKADDADFAVEYMNHKMNGKSTVYRSGVTAEHVAEAKSYGAALEIYLRKDMDSLGADEIKALSAGRDPDGGYWVPTAMSQRIIRKVHETTPMRQLANVEMVSGDGWEIPNDRGFVEALWVDDVSPHGETDTPQVGMRKIAVHNLQAMPRVSQNHLEDASRNIEAWLAEKVAIGFRLKEADAFVNGNGVGKPKGFMTYDQVEYDKAKDKTDADWRKLRFINSGSATGFGTNLDAFVKLLGSLKAEYRPNARFMMERTATTALRLMKDGDGRYLLDYSNTSRAQGSVFGYGITEGDDLAAISAGAVPVAFGDFRQAYTIVQRRGIRVLRDPFTKKPMVQFDHTARVGGDMVDFDALRVMKIAA